MPIMSISEVVESIERDARRKAIRKELGPGGESAEVELLQSLDDAEQKYEVALRALADTKAKLHANLSPQARAALQLIGRKEKTDLDSADDERILAKRRVADAIERGRRRQLSEGLDEAQRDLAKLQEHARAVNSGVVKIDDATRRRLVHNLTIAEDRVRECSR